MKTITLTITVPDGVEVAVSQQVGSPVASTPVQNGPQGVAAVAAGTSPICPKHGAEKVKPSTKTPGFYCTHPDESGPRGYCTWSSR